MDGIKEIFKNINQTTDENVIDTVNEHNNEIGKLDRKSTRLNSSHQPQSRMPSSA